MPEAENSRPVALITGAAKRVGATIARTLRAAGYDLALHYRQSQADLADLTQPERIVEACISRFGRLDALVNNASSFFPTPIGRVTAAQWDDLFNSNARAPLFLAQAAAPALRAAHGAIVNLVDIYAQRPLAGHPVYSMAKAALAMMTLALAKELAPEIRVNGVAPGAVLWPESGKAYADQAELIARTPLQRAGSPQDVATAVLFLLRDAKFTTGQIIAVDGGRSIAT
jgi:pteridine reductase